MSYYDPDDYYQDDDSPDMNGHTIHSMIQNKKMEKSCTKIEVECIEVVERLAEVYKSTFGTDLCSDYQERVDFHRFVMEGLDKCMEMRRSSQSSE